MTASKKSGKKATEATQRSNKPKFTQGTTTPKRGSVTSERALETKGLDLFDLFEKHEQIRSLEWVEGSRKYVLSRGEPFEQKLYYSHEKT